ncbi:unnamed protein product, partial [Prorocentrum cordatum]
ELSKMELEQAREQHAEIDSEYAAFLQQRKDKDEEFRLRWQGERLAASLKGTLENHFTTKGDHTGAAKTASDKLSRAEQGWPQPIIGKTDKTSEDMDTRQAWTMLEQAMSNKVAVGQAHKVIHAHYPRHTPPASKAAKA